MSKTKMLSSIKSSFSIFTKSIGLKLIIFVGVILIIAMGFLLYKVMSEQRRELIDEVIKGNTRFSETVRRATKYDMLKVRREALHRTIKDIGDQEDIEWVRVFNKEGMIMFSTKKEEIGEIVDMKTEACYACHSAEKPLERLPGKKRWRIFSLGETHRILGMVTPIYNERECYIAACHAHPETKKVLGVIDIAVSLTGINKDLVKVRNRMVLIFVVTIFLLLSLIVLLINKFVNLPVKRLLDGTKKIAEGDMEYKIPVSSNDEIGVLTESFNRMTESLAKAENKLKEWGKTLEVKVEERTKELETAQKQLLQSEKLASLGKMAAGVAHEINNPLTAVLTFSKLLLDDLDKNDPRCEDLQTIVDETLRCRDIVRGLLDFSRETKSMKKSADINLIIENTLFLIEHQAVFQDIEVVKNLSDNLPQISIDASQIKQVFMNMFLNAAEAMSGRGTLNITTTSDEDKFIVIKIKDTGCGISEKNIIKLFDPFFSTKKVGEGTGLGLSVTYGIIKAHNGSIDVKSKVGKGTDFIVRLPIQPLRFEEK